MVTDVVVRVAAMHLKQALLAARKGLHEARAQARCLVELPQLDGTGEQFRLAELMGMASSLDRQLRGWMLEREAARLLRLAEDAEVVEARKGGVR
jgi:hypothetical protein